MSEKKRSFRYLLKQLKGSWKFIWAAVIFIVFGAFFEFLGPKLIGVAVDSVMGTAPFDLPRAAIDYIEKLGGREFLLQHLYVIIGVFAFVAIMTAVCEMGRLYSSHNLGENLGYNMRQSIFDHLQMASFGYHKSVRTGDIIQRCSSDIDLVRNFVVEFTQLARVVAKIAIAYWFMFGISIKLALISFISVPAISVFSVAFNKKIAKEFTYADEAEGDLQALAQENLSAPRVVRAFGRQKWELDRFGAQNQEFTDRWVKVGDLLAVFWAGGDILTVFQVILVLCASTVLAVKGQVTTGDMVSFMAFNGMLSWPIRSLGRIIGDLSKATVALGRIAEITDAPLEDYESGVPFSFEKEIVFEDVHFAFDNLTVFEGLSLTIKKGQTVAVLGASGSGKSIMLALLCRFYTPQKGRITIDGVDVKDINLKDLRRNISLVMQEPFLFSKTIKENIAITDKDIDFGRVQQAAKIACIHDSVLSFRDGYDTIVGEKGVTLSGGQKQRVAIARTIYTGANVLMFDDSLSAVDAVTDKAIRANLAAHTKDLTCVIIGQRVNTLMQADTIFVLDKGRIVQQGSHEYLANVDGIYREIVKIQQDIIEKTQAEAGEEDV
ncbi:MAG: ABC transporter ATP-binding protein [Ruminococcaceae bacterium]|nr:ABC transporter ATP-binding protein [Oscillospiraceae bacterium]